MVKRRYLIIPLLILFFVVFQNLVVSKVIEWGTVKRIETVFDGQVHYRQVELKGFSLIFSDFSIFKGDSQVFYTKNLTLDYDFVFSSFQLKLDFKIDSPDIYIDFLNRDFAQFYREENEKFSLFNPLLTFEIKDGKVWEGDTSLSFDLSTYPLFYTRWEGSELKWDKGIFKGKFQNFDLAKISAIQQLTAPSLTDFNLHKGMLNGDLTFDIKDERLFFLESFLILDEVNFSKNMPGELLSEGLSEGLIEAFHGGIRKAIVDVSNKGEGALHEKGGWIPFFLGGIKFEGSWLHAENANPPFDLKDLEGIISFKAENEVLLSLKGTESFKYDISQIALNAEIDLNKFDKYSIDLDFKSQNGKRGDSSVVLKAHDIGAPYSLALLDLRNFGYAEYALIDRISKKLELNDLPFDLQGGVIDGNFKVTTVNFKPALISAEDLSVRNLKLFIKGWDVTAYAQNVAGFFKVDFSHKDPKQSVDAELLIVNGDLKLHAFGSELWRFSNIQTKLKISEGKIEKSLASVSLAGLKGSAEIDWLSPQELIKLKLEGSGKDIAQFLPDRAKTGILNFLADEEIVIGATFKEELDSLRVKGEMKGLNVFKEKQGSVDFGFDLKQRMKSLVGISDNPTLNLFWRELAHDLYAETAPPATLGIAQGIQHILINEAGYEGVAIANGWFQANNVNVERYVSPFLFPKGELTLSGLSDVRGVFDLNGLSIEYHPKILGLENRHIKITMNEPPAMGLHKVDFNRDAHLGTLPLAEAIFYDKSKGITFSSIGGEAVFWGKKAFINQASATSHNLDFQGSLIIDYSDPRPSVFDLSIKTDALEGRLTDAVELMKQIDPEHFLTSLPIDGFIHLDDKGAELDFHFIPDDFIWSASVAGQLTEGSWKENPYFSIQDLNLLFKFDNNEKKVAIHDLNGWLLMGEAGSEEKYAIQVDEANIDDLERLSGAFDIRLSDLKGEAARLKGKIVPIDDMHHLQFDLEATHLGDLKLSQIELKSRSLKDIACFSCKSNFRLSTFIHELGRFSRSGFPFLPASFYQKLNDLGVATGDLAFDLNYDEEAGAIKFILTGQEIALNDKSIGKLHIEGEKKGDVWSIKDALIDDNHFTADVIKESGKWKFEHIGLKLGSHLLAGLEGEWEEGSDILHAKINLFELQVDHLLDLIDGDELQKYAPKGILEGKGVLSLNPSDLSTLNIQLQANFKEFELLGIPCLNSEPFEIDFKNGHEVIFTGMTLNPHNNLGDELKLHLKRGRYDFVTSNFEITPLNFSLDAKSLPWTVSNLSILSQGKVSSALSQEIAALKTTGEVRGAISVISGEGLSRVILYLSDGVYQFRGKDWDLANFSVELSSDELKMTSQLKHQNSLLWVLLRTPSSYDRGVVVIADGTYEENDPITIHWHYQNEGMVLEKIKGSAQGIGFDLVETGSEGENLFLKGSLNLDFNLAKELLAPEIREKILGLKLGSGYQLKGHFVFNRENGIVSFDGDVIGTQVEFKGYRFDSLTGKLNLNPSRVIFKNIHIIDQAVSLWIPEGRLDKYEPDDWVVYIPKLEIIDLRPSQLDEGEGRPEETKPLLIKTIVVNELHGYLDPLSSIKGSGYLTFVNPIKKNLHNTIFKIPAEILSRIGIDLIALTPVTGSCQFDIRNEKVYLLKMKDVHSDGKLSKFYLASEPPSYIDFDGKLNVHIKMKQYTLLFKLAELLTFHIEGTLSKPTYSLKKHGNEEIKVD